MRPGRSEILLNLRNHVIVARYYYWSEIWDRRYEKVLDTLTHEEFFLAETTIQRIILMNDEYLTELRNRKPEIKELECKYPGFSWQQSLKASISKKQYTLELK